MTACTAPATPTTATPTTAPQAVAPVAQAQAPTSTPSVPKSATWGDTIALPSGLTFTTVYEGVKPATEYTSAGKYSGKTAVFKTTLKNGTTQPVPTSQWAEFKPILTAGADGHQAAANSWDGSVWPSAPTLQPGEATTWEFGVDDAPANTTGLRVEYSVPQYLGGGQVAVVWKGNVG